MSPACEALYCVVQSYEAIFPAKYPLLMGMARQLRKDRWTGLSLLIQHLWVMPMKCGQKSAPLRNVLLVDDDAAMRVLLPRILRRAGFQVHAVSDADSAEQALAQSRYEAVVIDIQLQGRDGLTLASAILERWPNIKIVLVTAYDSNHCRSTAATLGIKTFLTKPISVKELLLHLNY